MEIFELYIYAKLMSSLQQQNIYFHRIVFSIHELDEVIFVETAKKWIDIVLGRICVALFTLLVILVSWQVITRLILHNPSLITEDLAKYSFVWLVLFGGALVFGERGHLAVVIVKEKLPRKLRIGAEILIELVTAFFAITVLTIGGMLATEIAWNQLSAALQIPIGYMYISMPISSFFILFYCVYNIYDVIKKRNNIELLN